MATRSATRFERVDVAIPVNASVAFPVEQLDVEMLTFQGMDESVIVTLAQVPGPGRFIFTSNDTSPIEPIVSLPLSVTVNQVIVGCGNTNVGECTFSVHLIGT